MHAAGESVRAGGERRDAARAANPLALLRLLGASPLASVEIATAPWADPGAPDWRAILEARADLQRALASYEVAEGEFRRACAEQYPALLIAPGVGGDPVSLFGSVGITLPIGASKEARAAESARDAARHELQGAVLDALRDAETSRREAAAAASGLLAARARRAAQEEILRTAMAELEGRSGSFLDVVFAVEGLVDAATAEREAALDEVRARVRAARAAGWPVLP
jgi:outer membrane protein TolC